MQKDLMKILECRGNIYIKQNDKNVDMILALLIFFENIIKKNIYTLSKTKESGLWTKVHVSAGMKEEDILVVSSDDECEIGKKCIILNALALISSDDVRELENRIEKGHQLAYLQVKGDIDEYFEQVSYMPSLYYKNDLLSNRDYQSEYINIINGLRFSYENIDKIEDKQTVHFFGDSRMYGLYVGDEYTIPSLVSKKITKRCVNYGTHGTSIYDIRLQIEAAQIVVGDIVVINNGFIKSRKYISQQIVNASVVDEINKINDECIRRGTKLIVCIFPECTEKMILSKQDLNICIFQELQKIEAPNSNYFSLSADSGYVAKFLKEKRIDYCDLLSYTQYNSSVQFFVDNIHFGTTGNEIFSAIISKKISENIETAGFENINIDTEILRNEYKKIICERRGNKNSGFFDDERFENFIDNLKTIARNKPKESAVIVMNANPFTYGHQYIIEESLKIVPHIYILVVQEEHTVIPFEDRIELVKRGISHLKNITVIPSGEFVVSSVTLPEYFDKERKQNISVDASRDIDLFVKFIMPALNVRIRIAGEEPYCMITREYNRQIEEKFKENNLIFTQIPRRKQGEIFISASKVRKAVFDGVIDNIKDMVPETTYEYLFRNVEFIKERMRFWEVK